MTIMHSTPGELRRIARRLGEAAQFDPAISPHGDLNISSWVGAHTPEWYAVFSYSSPEPGQPWFCSLDQEAQRLVLLLVGQAMETEADEIRKLSARVAARRRRLRN